MRTRPEVSFARAGGRPPEGSAVEARTDRNGAWEVLPSPHSLNDHGWAVQNENAQVRGIIPQLGSAGGVRASLSAAPRAAGRARFPLPRPLEALDSPRGTCGPAPGGPVPDRPGPVRDAPWCGRVAPIPAGSAPGYSGRARLWPSAGSARNTLVRRHSRRAIRPPIRLGRARIV